MIFAAGSYIGLATAGLFYFSLGEMTDADILRAQTIAFTGIIVLEKVNVFNFRSLDRPISSIGWLSNRWLLLAIAITVGRTPLCRLRAVPAARIAYRGIILAGLGTYDRGGIATIYNHGGS